MERVAEPLRLMGAQAQTRDGRPPLVVQGGRLSGIRYRPPVPSAQVKGCVLLAGLAASGETVVEEPAPTRDHTERALRALGAPVTMAEARIGVSSFQHEGLEGTVPGDVSSAALLAAAAAVTRGSLVVRGVGLNPTRLGFLRVMARMGVRAEHEALSEVLGEPVGVLRVEPAEGLTGTRVSPDELPLVIDEVPVLAALAAHAEGETLFAGGGELREKESDRLDGLAEQIRRLGGKARVEGDDLVVAGGGLAGGSADSRGDHRMAMALAVAALGARGPSEIRGMESAAVSFPGFVGVLAHLGGQIVEE
jgi:3-phosphoshikimate 1-carboxyvinyltransferase